MLEFEVKNPKTADASAYRRPELDSINFILRGTSSSILGFSYCPVCKSISQVGKGLENEWVRRGGVSKICIGGVGL